MRRIALTTGVTAALVATIVGQEPQFEVASLRPSTRDRLSIVSTPNTGPGEVRLLHVPLRTLVLRGYPLPPPVEIVNLPGWANDPYDFVARGDPGATAEEQQQMFRAFLADRLKLTAHYETKDQNGYHLVFARADRRPGPGLKPTALDCTTPTPRPVPGPGFDAVEFATNRCGYSLTDLDGTLRSAGLTMDRLTRILANAVGRPVVDKTELSGFYAISFRFQQFPLSAGASPSLDDPPSVFTALPEQLGLKLEPATTTGQMLVIDHIERPTEN